MAAHKVRVHYFLRADRFWPNVLDQVESRLVEARLREEGIQLHYRTELAEILGRGSKVSGVRTGSGETLPCGVLAYAIGIRPRLELARGAGLKVDRGILVDEFLRTSDPHIFAAGDAAQVRDPLTGQFVLGSLWGPARQQGLVAGANMAGGQQAYSKPVAFNVTSLAGITATIIGAVGGGRDDDLVSIARGDSETWRSLPNAISAQTGESVNHLRLLVGERTLLGALLLGEQKLSRPLQELITSQVDISPVRSQLLQTGAPLGEIVMDFWLGIQG
jgi:NADPH-dependent 2,4-dienoyl-CoA reductase/sulfur reductase-like enzyme